MNVCFLVCSEQLNLCRVGSCSLASVCEVPRSCCLRTEEEENYRNVLESEPLNHILMSNQTRQTKLTSHHELHRQTEKKHLITAHSI